MPDERIPAIKVLLLPKDTNALGTIFGGVILSNIDLASAVEARKHAARRLVVEGAAGKSSNLLQDTFQKSLRDLAGIQSAHFGVDHGLNELAGRDANARSKDDFGGFLERGVSVVVQFDSDIGGFIHGLIEDWISVR